MDITEEAIRVTQQMQQRTDVLFQQFLSMVEEDTRRRKDWPLCGLKDRRAYPTAGTSTRNERASPTGKRKEHTQLPGTRETRNRDRALSNSAEGQTMHSGRCDNVRFGATKEIAVGNDPTAECTEVLGGVDYFVFPVFDVARRETEGRTHSGESESVQIVP